MTIDDLIQAPVGAALSRAAIVDTLQTAWSDIVALRKSEQWDALATAARRFLQVRPEVLAVSIAPDALRQQILVLASDLHRAERRAAAAALYRWLLIQSPALPDAVHLRGVALWQDGDPAAGAPWIARAIALVPNMQIAHKSLRLATEAGWAAAAAHERAGRRDEADRLYRALRHRSAGVAADAFRQWGDVDFHGLRLRLPTGDFTYHACRGAGYEANVTARFLQILRPGMTVVDIGANVGLFALLAARTVGPQGRVFAIEAVGRNAKIIQVNCELNRLENVQVIPIGLSDRVGADVWLVQNEHSNNVLFDLGHVADVAFDAFELIGVAPLDALLPAGTPVDVIKIDIEGREYKALQGGLSTIVRNRPVIFSEYSPAYLERCSGVAGGEYLRLVLDLGYDAEILHKNGQVESIVGATAAEIAARIDAVWDAERAGGGTHLDLCFQPRPAAAA